MTRKINRALMIAGIAGGTLLGSTGCVTPGDVTAGVNLGMSWAEQILRAWGML